LHRRADSHRIAAAVLPLTAERVIVKARGQGRIGREHVGDFREHWIEAVAVRPLFLAFEVAAKAGRRLNRPH